MNISDQNIDGGKPFDWGRTSSDYAKFRDIYPQEFYDKIIAQNLCIAGQSVLDIGTGTGVLPRNLYSHAAKWTGVDLSKEQIEYAKKLSSGMKIDYYALPAENIAFPDHSFDVITACQCFWYFHHEQLMPKILHMLKPNGRLLVLYMAWLPFEDPIAGASENLILKYNPDWSGAKETLHPIAIPEMYYEKFHLTYHAEYPLKVHFSRETWHGRVKACRGIGVSLSPEEIDSWEKEHLKMLAETTPAEFDVLHYAAMAILEIKKMGR